VSAEAPLPRHFLRPCILLLLRESPAHGYDLLERLTAFGFSGSDPGGLYRALRGLETDGLVRSAWERSSAGPERRIYALTRAGMTELHEHAKSLERTVELIETFISRYSEFVALGRRRAPAGPRR
jgi:poly-beta-hydroxybutyrate-responsive repressor